MPKQKLLIIDIAALGWDFVQKAGRSEFQKIEATFPGVTCSAQAAFRTAAPVSTNGVASNGFFFRDLKKVLFWEQASSLVSGPRIWENFRARGGRVGMMFWQQSLGEDVDLVLSPTPIHKHSGGMIQSCYTMPRDLEARLNEKVGRAFNLMNYWGPLANRKSSDWIVDATCATMTLTDAPELLLTYIPHLDYDLQRHGPDSAKAKTALDVLLGYLERLKKEAVTNGYEWLLFGDYAIEPVRRGAIFPNRKLREAGLFSQREIKGMSYADFFSTPAFAMVDHQIAHVFCRDGKSATEAANALSGMVGIRDILNRDAQKKYGLDHRNSGDLVLIAEPGAWFAYPWWKDKSEAPDFATHVDIHNKPGYDPCELFFGWPPLSVSQDTKKIRGTHGRPGENVAWASSIDFPEKPATLIDLASATKNWLDAIWMTGAPHIVSQKITVPFDFPVVFTHHVFAPENRALLDALCRLGEERRHRAIVYLDSFVADARPDLQKQIAGYFTAHSDKLELVGEPRIVPGGEAVKNDVALCEKMILAMLDARLDRHAFVIIVGGGAVLDAVGFAAALVHRGLRTVRVPTTVLSQNDGGVGVKNGINFFGGKNAIGTFWPPFAVIDDFQFLLTLDDRAWLDGVAEAFKVSIIRDAHFFDWLCDHAARLRARDFDAMQQLVTRCAVQHLDHIRTNGDPFELGRARPLDFGHWAAHKLELMSGFKISHGEAVAVGMLLDCWYAVKKNWLTEAEFDAIHRGLAASGLPVWFDELEKPSATDADTLEIFNGLRDFQEHLGGELCVTYPNHIGARHEVHEVDLELMREAVAKLKSLA